MTTLASDTIFEVIAATGATMRGKGDKRTLCCVLHDEDNPSAFAVGSKNIYGCAVCFPGTAITAKRLAELKGLDWTQFRGRFDTTFSTPTIKVAEPEFTAADAQAVHAATRARMLDDSWAGYDGSVYEYLEGRGLGEAWDLRLYGVLAPGMSVHPAAGSWASRGYRVVVPLYDAQGHIACVQARNTRGGEPRTLAPKNSKMAGTVFANERGIALLRGEPCEHDTVILGEGLTDFLAFSCAAFIPVFAAPGTSTAEKAIGPWVRDRTLIVALDCDAAGDEVRPKVCRAAFDNGALRVRTVKWPKGAVDACDVVAARGVHGLASFLRSEVSGTKS